MSYTTHTPAPWRYSGADDGFIIAGDSLPVAQLFDKNEDNFYNCEANGLLIAAAPDLLEACRAMQAICHELPNTLSDVAPLIEAAIAKARGASPSCPHCSEATK